jgi:guanylate kinase
MKQIFFIITAPSGAGKNTVINALLQRVPFLRYAKSATTRAMRPGESQGKPYYFLTIDEFNTRIAQGDFYEYQEVYKDLFYGTLKEEINRIWTEGNAAISDIEVVGAQNIKTMLGDSVRVIFLAPPSIKDLENRLRARGKETEEQITERLKRVQFEMGYKDSFDHLVINQELDVAVAEVEQLIKRACEPELCEEAA